MGFADGELEYTVMGFDGVVVEGEGSARARNSCPCLNILGSCRNVSNGQDLGEKSRHTQQHGHHIRSVQS